MIISEVKKDAKIKLTGSYTKSIIIYFIYFLILFATSFLGMYIKNKYLNYIYQIVVMIFTIPLSFGIIASFIKISRNEDVSFTDFIKIGFKNMKGVWRTYGRTLLKIIIPMIIFVLALTFLFYSVVKLITITPNVPEIYLSDLLKNPQTILAFILTILSIILVAYIALPYSLAYYTLYDNPEFTGKEVIEKSKDLMKNNKLNLILLLISFIPWFLLIYLISYIFTLFLGSISVFISTILCILIAPYITTSTVCFYEELLIEKNN